MLADSPKHMGLPHPIPVEQHASYLGDVREAAGDYHHFDVNVNNNNDAALYICRLFIIITIYMLILSGHAHQNKN